VPEDQNPKPSRLGWGDTGKPASIFFIGNIAELKAASLACQNYGKFALGEYPVKR